MGDESFSKEYPTWIIAFCPDTDSFFITRQRRFFWEFSLVFQTEEQAIKYFEEHAEYFVTMHNHLAKACGGIKSDADKVFLENTKKHVGIEEEE